MNVYFMKRVPLVLLTTTCALAQIPTAVTISGTVFDPSHAGIVHAAVHLQSEMIDLEMVTDGAGHYKFAVPPATYVFTVEAPGFRQSSRTIVVPPAGPTLLNVTLDIATDNQQVDVAAIPESSTAAADNASSMVFHTAELDTLSDDPNLLQQQLLALSGDDPSSPAQIYVDGFSNGTVPPKESIREIRINQNPFTAQFDQFGLGRIEIFTKPGTNKLHGTADATFGSSAFNARNPYTPTEPSYLTDLFDASLSGPAGKGTSFYLSGRRFDVPGSAVVNASTLDANLEPITVSQSIANPNIRQAYSLRGDRQFGASDTVIGRYLFDDISQPNLGIGQFVLASQASTSDIRANTLQLSDTHILNPRIVMDAAFQYVRLRQQQDGLSTAPSIVVQGAFSAGGSPSQTLHDDQDRFEIRDYFSISHGPHFIRTGARYRFLSENNLNSANTNGQFIFPSLTAFQITQQGLRQHLTDQQIRATCTTAADGTVTCGGATQFSLTTGNPRASIRTGDLSVYAEDEWKVRPSLSFNYGFRIENQSSVPDHVDLAPRLGFAWSVKPRKAKSPLFVLRGGFGLFFTRFDSTFLIQAQRQNGVDQIPVFVTNPVYACAASVPPPCLTPDLAQATGSATSPTVYRLSPHLRSPIQMQGLVTLERSFGKRGQIAVNYYHLRTTHLYDSLNVNAPFPGTGIRPLGGTQNVYQYSSEGVGKWFLFTTNLSFNLSRRLSLWAFASDGRRNQTSVGPDQFPSNSYNPGADYGPPASYAPQQFTSGVSAHPGWGTTFNLFVQEIGARFYNVTTGRDNNGDSIYNDRPAFATNLTRKSVFHTIYGNFDTDPLPGQTIIPFNYVRRPNAYYTQISFNKELHLGPRTEAPINSPSTGKLSPPSRPYQLQLGVEIDNILNHVNPATPVGIVTSPSFGRSLTLSSSFTQNSAANRALQFHARFSF